MCKTIENREFKELKDTVVNMNTNVALLANDIKRLNETTSKLVEIATEQNALSTRVSETEKKIGVIFKKMDFIYENGVKDCPLNSDKIESLKHRLDKLDKYFITVLLVIALQFLMFVLHFIDKTIPM